MEPVVVEPCQPCDARPPETEARAAAKTKARASKVDSKEVKREVALARKGQTAKELACKGFSVQQLVDFWRRHHQAGRLNDNTYTYQVVRDIVIPETSSRRCCYMDVMPGGPKEAATLVSHWWGTHFKDLVRGIVNDATGLVGKELEAAAFGGHRLDAVARNKSYWLCIFAVNQHVSICGMCSCDSEDYAANPCRQCRCKKRNPCPCGSKKYPAGHEMCQVDKFHLVMRHMTRLLVVLDRRLKTLTRAWVVAEIGEALFTMRPIEMSDPGDALRSHASGGVTIQVQACEASLHRDKERILKEIEEKVGIQYFNERVTAEVNKLLHTAKASKKEQSCRSSNPHQRAPRKGSQYIIKDLLALYDEAFGATDIFSD